MRVEKWHGIGNAYLVIEEADLDGLELTPERVARICHPDLGAGSDGILLVSPAGDGRHRVRIFNPDGGEAEFSGNGTRIAVGYLAANDGVDEVALETIKGAVRGSVDGRVVTVDAGRAALEGDDHVPGEGAAPADRYTFVSLGNPHCVIETADLEHVDLPATGPLIEHHGWFPNRTNVEFYRVAGADRVEMRVWERGAGETLSSGSGASATAVAAVTAGQVTSPVTVSLPGGELSVAVSESLEIQLTGPVERVLSGAFADDFLATLRGL